MENKTKTKQKIIETILKINPNCSAEEIYSLMEQHLLFLLSENKKYNLTGIDDFDTGLERHVLDSIIPVEICLSSFMNAQSMIELGSGGGYPGIPIAILFPQKNVVLVESINKKANFLRMTAKKLNLKNIEICCERLETLAHKKTMRQQFDIAVSRALGSLPIIAELSIPFLRTGGVSIALKGKSVDVEMQNCDGAMKILKAKLVDKINYALINYSELRIIIMKKISETPNTYPRDPGIIKKSPLL